MRRSAWLLIGVVSCGKNKGEGADAEPEVVPVSCIADEEVCIAFTADWSQDDADTLCAEFGGVEGECAQDELGHCLFEDGLAYYLYDMPPLDAEAYCEYLGGLWLEPGEEPEEE